MILIFLDGVLRAPNQGPLYEGTALFHALKDSKKVNILSKNNKDADRWLKLNNLGKVDDLYDYSYIATATENHDYKLVEYCRSQAKIELVITADVELAEKLLTQGLHVLLFLHPMYIRPEFRPDGRGRRAWDAITAELDKQQELYAEDSRT